MPPPESSRLNRDAVVVTADLPVVLSVLSDHVVLLRRNDAGQLVPADHGPSGSGNRSQAPDLLAASNLATLDHACAVAETNASRVTFAAEHTAGGKTRVLECTVVPVYDRPESTECAAWVCAFRDVAADYFRLVLEQRSLPGIAGDLAHALEQGIGEQGIGEQGIGENGDRNDNHMEIRWNPIREFRTGRVVNAVASYQWHHPRLGSFVPSAVVEVAHNAGLLAELNAWLLDEVCHAAVDWPPSVPSGEIGATISLTPHGLNSASFVRSVMRSLSASGLPPHRLTIDVDASLLAADDGVLPAVMGHVQALGVQLGVANFGRSIANFQRTIAGRGLRTVRIAPGLTSGVAADPHRRAALATMVDSLRVSDCQLAVQSVSSTEDQAVLRELGFDLCAGGSDEQRFDSESFAAWLTEAPERPLHSPS